MAIVMFSFLINLFNCSFVNIQKKTSRKKAKWLRFFSRSCTGVGHMTPHAT